MNYKKRVKIIILINLNVKLLSSRIRQSLIFGGRLISMLVSLFADLSLYFAQQSFQLRLVAASLQQHD